MNYRWNIMMTIAIVALGAALAVSLRYGVEKERECRRLAINQIALTEDIRTFRVRDSLNAASAVALTMTVSELRKRLSDVARLVDDMGIKLRRVQSVAQSAVESRYTFSAPVADSTVSVRTPHLSFEGRLNGNELQGRITTVDTLTQVIHRVPKRFLFFRFGTRYFEQTILSSNPASHVVYERCILVR